MDRKPAVRSGSSKGGTRGEGDDVETGGRGDVSDSSDEDNSDGNSQEDGDEANGQSRATVVASNAPGRSADRQKKQKKKSAGGAAGFLEAVSLGADTTSRQVLGGTVNSLLWFLEITGMWWAEFL